MRARLVAERKLKAKGVTYGSVQFRRCGGDGHGLRGELARAVEMFREATEEGSAPAMMELGFCYHMGYGVAQDQKAAVKWYLQAATAPEPVAMAQWNLYIMYSNGHGVAKNPTMAYRWAKRSTTDNDSLIDAMFHLSQRYMYDNVDDDGRSVEPAKDEPEALRLYHRILNRPWCDGCHNSTSACRDNCDSSAVKTTVGHTQYMLGMVYDSQWEDFAGVEKDDEAAFEWYTKVNPVAVPSATRRQHHATRCHHTNHIEM